VKRPNAENLKKVIAEYDENVLTLEAKDTEIDAL